MPTKFKKDGVEYKGSRANRVAVKKKYFISAVSKQELIDYVNSSNAKPKIRQKCLNELTRRGVKLNWLTPEEVEARKAEAL